VLLCLKINIHLPVNIAKDETNYGKIIKNFQLTLKIPWQWTWPWIVLPIYQHRPLCTYSISFKSETFCGWM